MRRIKWLVPVLAIVLLVGMAPDAQAQVEKPWSVELLGGVFLPLSPTSWTDAVGTSAGVGAVIGHQVTPKIYILANGVWGFVSGATVENVKLPDWDVFGLFLSGAYDFTAGKSVSVMGQVGVGVNSYKLKVDGASSENDFAAQGGFRFRYNISPVVGLTANALVMVSFSDPDAVWNLPISAGIFFRF